MNAFGSIDHRAQVTLLLLSPSLSPLSFQVILYCLMLSDRHQTPIPNGLLYYMKTGHTQSVPAPCNETMSMYISSDYVLFILFHCTGLVQIRNRLARFHGNYWDHMNLPKLSHNRRMCLRCPLVKKCTLYHR